MNPRPHIVIFNPDQWRGDVLGHMGNPAAVTPVLDRLVETDAVSFRHAFCQNPVCTPSRCSFMTGWYPHVRGHRTMHHMLHDERGEQNLLALLRKHGYFVWWGGKNDLVPRQNGFTRHCDIKYVPTEHDYRRWGLTARPDLHGVPEWRGEPGGDTYYSFYAGRLDTGGQRCYADHDWANVLGAIDFIKNAPPDKPLCIYLPLGYPHPPYGVEDPWFSAIDRAKLPPRTLPPDDWNTKPKLLRGIRERQNLTGWTEDRWTQLRATYYGMCARVDHQLGLIIDALRATGMYDDTALFTFSDHGDYTGDFGIVEKTQNTFEDPLTRVPLVIKPPRSIPVKPRVTDAMAELVDFPATVYEMAGIDPGYTHFGRSLLPVLAGTTDAHRDAVFCEGGRNANETHCNESDSLKRNGAASLYWPRVSLQASMPEHAKGVMCRTRTHKYIHRLGDTCELYDLRSDPIERVNRIHDPALSDTLAALRERTLSWMMETADVVPYEIDVR